MNYAIFLGFCPLSWKIGCIRRKPNKVVYSLGPFRLALHDFNR